MSCCFCLSLFKTLNILCQSLLSYLMWFWILTMCSTGLIASRYHWGNVCKWGERWEVTQKWGECWEVTQKYLTSETERYQFMHFKSLLLSCPRWLQRYWWYTKHRIVNHPKKFSIITGSVILTTPIQSFYMMVQFITRYYQIKFAKGSGVLGIVRMIFELY